ncbi:MAG: NUDIX hydrolase [Verrucomicrobiota bacterium]
MSNDYLNRLPEHLRYRGNHAEGEIELQPVSSEDSDVGIIYEDLYVLVVRDPVRFPSGVRGAYLRVINQSELTGSGGTVVLPIWDGKVVFIRIFRHPTRSWEWELPRGFQEPGITEEENVVAEMREEIGVGTETVIRLGAISPNTGLLSGRVSVYQAHLSASPLAGGNPGADEGIQEVREVPLMELDVFLLEHVTCGFSLSAVTLARLRKAI